MDKEEKKQDITLEDLMQQNLNFQNEINVYKSKEENFQNQINDKTQMINNLQNEVERLREVNQQFFLQLSKQDEGQISKPIVSQPIEDNSLSFDEFINKLIE